LPPISHNKSSFTAKHLEPISTFQQAPSKPPPQVLEDKQIQAVRKILGDVGKDLTTEELQAITTEIQFLVDNWLDDFEKELFDGQTLQQLLNERGSV
jgi:hypothetical protein